MGIKINEIDVDGRKHWQFWCPGCNEPHGLNDGWTFDGEYESPTFLPSIKVWYGPDPPADIPALCCHSYITNGRIEFLDDCTHDLAGQTVDLPDWAS